MRKKCTNSSCRRKFSVEAEDKVSCPFCGKVYPRMIPVPAARRSSREFLKAQKKTGFSVVLFHCGTAKVNVMKVIRKYTGLGLKDTVQMMNACPSIIRSGLTFEDAQMIQSELLAAGATAWVKRLTDRETQYYYTA